jgi:hypothetical protein
MSGTLTTSQYRLEQALIRATQSLGAVDRVFELIGKARAVSTNPEIKPGSKEESQLLPAVAASLQRRVQAINERLLRPGTDSGGIETIPSFEVARARGNLDERIRTIGWLAGRLPDAHVMQVARDLDATAAAAQRVVDRAAQCGYSVTPALGTKRLGARLMQPFTRQRELFDYVRREFHGGLDGMERQARFVFEHTMARLPEIPGVPPVVLDGNGRFAEYPIADPHWQRWPGPVNVQAEPAALPAPRPAPGELVVSQENSVDLVRALDEATIQAAARNDPVAPTSDRGLMAADVGPAVVIRAAVPPSTHQPHSLSGRAPAELVPEVLRSGGRAASEASEVQELDMLVEAAAVKFALAEPDGTAAIAPLGDGQPHDPDRPQGRPAAEGGMQLG